LIGPTPNVFGTSRALPNRSISLWTLRHKIETNVFLYVCPTFSLYVQGSPTWGKPKRDRTEMLSGTCWGNNLRTWGTWCEHIESNGKR
jgi:hypothetical protein